MTRSREDSVRSRPQHAALSRNLLFDGGKRQGRSFGRRTAAIGLTASMLIVGQSAHGASLVGPTGTGRQTRSVTLLTGERVVVGTSPGGRPTLQIVRAAQKGPASPLTTASLNGDQYVIPASAQPYVGRYLDIRLFDVTKLAAAGITDRVPLRITYTAGTSPSLPGVTITSSGGGVATGYVTPSSARVFGSALASQAVADSQAK